MQSQNRFFEDISRMASGAMGALAGLREEIETAVRNRMDKAMTDMNLVAREEFDAVKAMAEQARAENETLQKRIADLEKILADASPAKKPTPKKPAAKKSAPRKTAKAADEGGPEVPQTPEA